MISEQINGIDISGIQFDRFGKAVGCFIPETAASFYVAVKQEKWDAVRQLWTGDNQLFARPFVVSITAKIVIGLRQVRLSRIRTQLQCRVDRLFGLKNAIGIEIKLEKVKQIVRSRFARESECEIRVPGPGFLEKVNGLQQRTSRIFEVEVVVHHVSAPKIKIVSNQ